MSYIKLKFNFLLDIKRILWLLRRCEENLLIFTRENTLKKS